MPLTLSQKSGCVMQSEIRTMTIECEAAGGINLSQGVCDLEVPAAVRRAAQAAMDEGVNTYTRYNGRPSLRAAIARKLERYYGLRSDPETEITVSSGSTGAFYCACLTLLDPGDEVILFEPYYGYHLSTLQAVGAVPAYVPLTPPHWTFDPRDLEAARTSRTKGIMVCSPSNPTGKIFTQEELAEIGAFVQRNDLCVFTDEIYEHFVYEGRRHIPPATVEGLGPRTITISGLSKTFSITGWRIGYSYAPPELSQLIGYFNDLVYVCAPAPLQEGVARGLETLPASYYEDLCVQYSRKRDRICSALDRGGMKSYPPQGAYYVMADVSRVPGRTSKERAMNLLHRIGVACVPGDAFYRDPADGKDVARFCFAKSDRDLGEACRRLESVRW